MKLMRLISLVLLCIAFVPLMAADKKPITKEESAKVIEAGIRKAAKKPTGELTKADLEKVTELDFKEIHGIWSDLKNLMQTKVLDFRPPGSGMPPKAMMEGWEEQLKETTIMSLAFRKTLSLNRNKLTDVKGLEKLTKLTFLDLRGNTDLTKAQIDQLKKALPKCRIIRDF